MRFANQRGALVRSVAEAYGSSNQDTLTVNFRLFT